MKTTPDQLRALADRCEAAMENDRDLFEEAFLAVYPDILVGSPEEILSDRFVELLDIGAFLDAATALVPTYALHMVRTVWDEIKTAGIATISQYEDRKEGDQLRRYWLREHEASASTPALALCAASLRARAASMEEG